MRNPENVAALANDIEGRLVGWAIVLIICVILYVATYEKRE